MHRPWPRAPRKFFLWRLINLKIIAKLCRDITSEFALKPAKMQSSRPGFGNLCPVASLNQNLQGMAGRTYFPRTDPVSLLFMMLKLSRFVEFQSDWLLIFTVHNENPKHDKQYIYSTVRFLLSSSSKVCSTRNCKEGRFIKYGTTRRVIQLLQVLKGLRAVGCRPLI